MDKTNEELTQEVESLQQKIHDLEHDRSRLGIQYETQPEQGEAQRLLNGDIPVLVRDEEHSTLKSNEGINHLLIEGDNLSSLMVLKQTHSRKINVIYIDPPYNTGNDDFVYNDRFVNSEDTFRHSKWLSFMKPRLLLARDLLTDDGVIFVSIDDHEQAYLKILMDEIFGEKNFVADMILDKSSGGKQDSQHIATLTEYVLVYAKLSNALSIRGIKKDFSSYILKDKHYQERGSYRLNQLDRSSLSYSKSLDYPLVYENHTYIPHASSIEEMKIRQDNTTPRKDWQWRWSKRKTEWGIKNDFIVFKNGKIYSKEYTKVDNNNQPIEKSTTPYNTLRDSSFSSRSGNNEIISIFGNKTFSYPKSVQLIKHLISLHPNDDSIVLDFFAGSGTTGQAVAELNAEDGGHRQAILCTNNFEQDGSPNGIARDVTSVRMRRVLTGEHWADGKEHAPLPGNLVYYRIDFKENVPKRKEDMHFSFNEPEDYLGIEALMENAHIVCSPDIVPESYKILREELGKGTIRLLTNEGREPMICLYSDEAQVESKRFFNMRKELHEWKPDSSLVYNDNSSENDYGTSYPIPYVEGIRRTVSGMVSRGVLIKE
jgi:adenine-specific DNA-methyltransferase